MLRFFRGNREKWAENTHQAVKKSRETWFGRIIGLFPSSKLDEGMWDELEEILISSDAGVNTSLSIVENLKAQAQQAGHKDPHRLMEALKQELVSTLKAPLARSSFNGDDGRVSPLVILVVGVNGVGKTTSVAKLAYYFKEQGQKVILGAADTFRAAAIDQLQILGQRVNADVISYQQGGDPGAVVFDAFQASRARGADVLIVDTAGRLHTKSNLMDELKKIRRVLSRLDSTAPHEVILTLDATTGQNGLTQARHFRDAVDCTGIFLAKLDGTARGGIVLAITRELDLPILFIGTGEQLQDMAPFDAENFVDALLAPVP